MNAILIDTQAAVDRLTEEGRLEPRAARSIVKVLTQTVSQDLATKADLQGITNDSQTVKGELQTEIVEFRHAVKADLQTVKGELQAEIAELRSEIAELRTEMRSEIAVLRSDLEKTTGVLRGEIHAAMVTQVRWMFGIMAGFSALIVALLRFWPPVPPG